MSDEKDLRIRSNALAIQVIKLFPSLPKSPESQLIGKQLLRSGTSVGANYREAYRARSDAEFVSILGICLKELEETVYWLELLAESEIVHQSKLSSLLDESDQLIAIFTSIVKTKKRNIHNS